MSQDHNTESPEDERASKSQRKREMLALQKLGQQLTELKPRQLAQIPLDEPLREAITELENIHHREGRRRHLQFIGKLMRNSDHQAIKAAFDNLQHQGHQQVQQQPMVEQWLERLLADPDALPAFIDAYKPDNIQQLRQLVRRAQKSQTGDNQPPANKRKLFLALTEAMGR